MTAVPLTSVVQPRHLIGRTATGMLIAEARERGSAEDPAHEHRQVVLTPELVVRASSRLRTLDGAA